MSKIKKIFGGGESPQPPPPPAPTPGNSKAEALAEAERKRKEQQQTLKSMRGRRSSVLTSSKGVKDGLGVVNRPEATSDKLGG